MSPSPEPTTEPFNLLSIGQRGVGKTVFLAGSYAELHSGSQTLPQPVWFDCQNRHVQQKIEEILNYVAQTGQYPPPTMKVIDFSFRLAFRDLLRVQTVCDFRWWDIPGEICNVGNPGFRKMVITSQGCCVFIDAYALMYEPAYLQALEDILEQVRAVVDLASLNHQLEYAFALILTKADLLDPSLLSQQQPEENLTLLTAHLDAAGINYQIFYSVIPIVSTDAGFILKATGAATPLLWLVWQLRKAHVPSLANKLPKSVAAELSSYLESQHPVNDLSHTSQESGSTGIRKRLDQLKLRLKLLPTAQRYILVVALACISSVGVLLGLRFYEQVLQK